MFKKSRVRTLMENKHVQTTVQIYTAALLSYFLITLKKLQFWQFSFWNLDQFLNILKKNMSLIADLIPKL